MGTDITPDNIRGFVVSSGLSMDNIWTAESSYTNASPQPAAPQPNGDYDLGLTASGGFTSTDSLRIQTQIAGHVGRASFVWRESTETEFYGFDPANSISRWDSIINGTALVTIDNILLDCIGNTDGSSVMLYQNTDTSGGTRTIRAVHRDTDGTLTSTNIYSQTSLSQVLYGGLCRLSDDSLLAVYMRSNTANNAANLQSARSYDNGLTWFVQSTTCLPTDIDLAGSFGAGNTGFDNINRIRIAESRGEILLIIAAVAHNTTPASTDVILQYVSTDNGCSFVFVAQTNGQNAYYRPDLVVRNSVFLLGYIIGTGDAEILEMESATVEVDTAQLFAPVGITDELVAGTLVNKAFTEGEMVLWSNTTGRLYAAFFDVDTDKRLFILQSDDVETWYYLGGNPGSSRVNASQIYDIDDASSRPSTLAACNARGVNHLYHNYETASHSRDNGIHLLELGGYSTVNMPAVVDYPSSFDYGGWDYTWVPYDSPDNTAHYTAGGTGGTITAQAEYTEFTSTVGNNKYVQGANFTSSSAEGIIFRTRLRSVAEGAALSGRGITVLTTDNELAIWVSLTGITVYDELASSTVGSLSFDTTVQFEILCAINSNNVKVWVRQSANVPKEKRWVEVASGALNSTGGHASQYVRWGHPTLTSGATRDTETEWYEFHYCFGSRTGDQIRTQQNPEDLNARQYPPKGQYVYVAGETRISTFDGPAYEGEYYTIEEDSLYPLRRVFHSTSPTPRQTYRSANDTSDHKFAWYWDATVQANANTDVGINSIGICLSNINFKTFQIHVYDVSTLSWVSLGTVTNSIGGATWERLGAAVRSTLVTTTGEYVEQDECKGYKISMGSGIVRTVASNTSGYLSNTTTSKRAVLQLADVENTDPTTFSGSLIPSQCTFIRHLTSTTAGAAIRITVPAQDTAEDYFEIGSVLIGPLIVTQQYSNGRTITEIPGALASETQDAVRRVRSVHGGYRVMRIAWTDGVDMTDVFDTSESADYYVGTTAAGALPISAPADTPRTIMGLLRQLDGESRPLVYLPSINVGVKTFTTFNTRKELMLCTIQEDVSIEHVLGEENSTEVFRVATMTLREII